MCSLLVVLPAKMKKNISIVNIMMTEGEQQISCINPFILTSSNIKGLLLEKHCSYVPNLAFWCCKEWLLSGFVFITIKEHVPAIKIQPHLVCHYWLRLLRWLCIRTKPQRRRTVLLMCENKRIALNKESNVCLICCFQRNKTKDNLDFAGQYILK